MQENRGGVLRRLVAGGASAAVAVAGLALGLAAPAHAAPVAVTGTLTDAAGNALDGVVTPYRVEASGAASELPFVWVNDGAVSIALEPGTYKFEFGDGSGQYATEFYNDKPTLEAADGVSISGAVTLAPVALAAAPRVVGKVVNGNGRPIKDTEVTLYDATSGNPLRWVQTERDGTFAIGTPSGTYKLGFHEYSGNYVPEFYNNKTDVVSADPIAVGTGAADVGNVTLSTGSSITGRVTNPTGGPLERVRVSARTGQNSASYSDLTDANGAYRIEGLRPGGYTVDFSDPVQEYLPEYYSDKADFATADPVAVGIDASIGGIDAALAPDPSKVVNPGDVDLTGTVTDSSGAPVIGATVAAFDTPADSDEPAALTTVRSNRAGQYFFTTLDRYSEKVVRVQGIDGLEREEGQYLRLNRWVGGAAAYAGASDVSVPSGGVNLVLPLTGGISGTVTSESGLDVDGVGVTFFDERGNPATATGASVEIDGTYTNTGLVPGRYKVQFVDHAVDYAGGSVGAQRFHAPEWYDNDTFAKAEVVIVKSGKTASGISAALNEHLRALSKPRVVGKPYLGGKVRATPGVWSVDSGTVYSYEWLLGDTVLGTGRTLKVPRSAKNKRITLRVVASNDGLSGTALVSTQVIKKKPRVKVTVKGARATVTVSGKKVKPAKIKGTVVVRKIVRTDDYGTPVYKKIGKAKLSNGRALVKLAKLTKGKNKLVFLITLKGGKLGDATVAKTIKLKR